jgi:hypothetical protein
MSDLKCTKCGIERSYADANIADLRNTCGSTGETVVVDVEDCFGETRQKYAYPGEKHNWVEI